VFFISSETKKSKKSCVAFAILLRKEDVEVSSWPFCEPRCTSVGWMASSPRLFDVMASGDFWLRLH
jgi:hypothetical protein